MTKKIDSISWEAIIDGKRYGSAFSKVTSDNPTNEEIREAINTLGWQMLETLQKVINGNTDTELRISKMIDKTLL